MAVPVSQAILGRATVFSIRVTSSDESIGTVATQYRIAAERGRKQKAMEERVAKLEDELTVTAATSGGHLEGNPVEAERIMSQWKRHPK